MKSARHNRLLKNAEIPNPLVTVDQINKARSFGAKAFNKRKKARKQAENSRKVNRA